MLLILLIVLWLVYLYWGWPSNVKYYIRKHKYAEKQFNIIVIFILLTIYVALVFLGEDTNRAWQRTDTSFNALLITSAIVFSAIKLFPPTFYAFFESFADFEAGRESGTEEYNINVPEGIEYPVVFVAYNTSAFTWNNFRVDIWFHPEDIEILESAPEIYPECKSWPYMPKEGSLRIGPGRLQFVTSILTIGELFSNRFFVKAKHQGEYDVTITITSEGRIRGGRQSLKLSVVGGKEMADKMKNPLTKKQFEETLTRVFTTPIPPPQEGGEVKTETSGSRPSGDYSGKRKSQGKTGDKQG